MGDEENLIQELRALIISSKGGITFRDLRRDLLEIGGSEASYRKLGFRNIEHFVESYPKEFRINNFGLVFASEKEESQHIQRLVNQQSGKRRSRIDFNRPSLRPASRYNANPRSSHSSNNRRHLSNRNLGQADLRHHLNEKHKIQPLMETKFSGRQVQESKNNILTIKKEWPKELFLDGKAERTTNSFNRDIPPRFQKRLEDTKQNVNIEEPKSLPIFQYKAKEPGTREPYRHREVSDTHNVIKEDDSDDDDEELFKDVPPLDDPKPVAKTEKPPVTLYEPSPTQTIIKEKSPKITVSLPFKNPVASRLARFKAETQIQPLSSSNGLTHLPGLRSRLDELSKSKGISGPEIKVMSHVHGVEKLYTCLVKVGDNVYSSDYGSDASKAETLALHKAFDSLYSELLPASPPAPIIENAAITKFVSGLQEILEKLSNGLWMFKIPETYKTAHGEDVPVGWEEAVKINFEVIPMLGKFIIYPKKTVQVTSESNNISPALIQLPKQEFSVEISSRKLPALNTPKERYWDLYVLMCPSPVEVFARLIGPSCSDTLDELLSLLEVEMLTEKKVVSFPMVGEIYAICGGDNGASRGRLETILPNKMCRVYFIDEGHCEDLSLDNLYYLDNKYFDLPAQAFKIVLKGLETFPVTSHFNLISPCMSRRICVAEIIETYSEDTDDALASAILWDTTTENDINLNCKIMEDTVTALVDPSMSHEYPRDMIISHVGDNIYLRTADKSIDCISSLINFILSCNNPQPVTQIHFKEVYLALDPINRVFVRAVVREIFEEKCVVFLIDYGNSCEIPVADLYHVQTICPALSKAAPQAIKVTLAGVGMLQSIQEKYLKLLVDSKESVLVTIVKIDNGVPCVSLHRRIGTSNLQNVNVNNILMTAENGKEIQGPMKLSSPTLPTVESFFSVRVTLAFSPSSFMVQCDESLNRIDDLMEELQSCNLESTEILQPNEIEWDLAYAVKYSENWYRAEITYDMGTGDVGIRLCDFGDTASVPLTSIRKLPDKFYRYPKFAIRATLADIAPINRDWCPADCVFFKETVVGRNLAGILKAITYDDDDEPILELKLIDTSGDDDVDISLCLVENGIANYC